LTVVLYSIAHSDPNDEPGVVTPNGISERDVAEDAATGLFMRLKNRGIRVERFSGPLERTVRVMRETVRALRKLEEKHVCLELHFNSPPPAPCDLCGRDWVKGVACPYCGHMPARRWRMGHTALVSRYHESSVMLADAILTRLSELFPWSNRRPPIKLPDHRYGPKVWPESMSPPAALIEAGFACDPDFAMYVRERISRIALGQMVAEGVLDFLAATSDIQPAEWGRSMEVRRGLG